MSLSASAASFDSSLLLPDDLSEVLDPEPEVDPETEDDPKSENQGDVGDPGNQTNGIFRQQRNDSEQNMKENRSTVPLSDQYDEDGELHS